MNVEIQRATPDQAEALTEIAFAAKRHWGYPERWIQLWSPILTVSAEFIEKHDTYIAYLDGEPAGFYAISVEDNKASLEHLWVLPESYGQGHWCEIIQTRTLAMQRSRGAYTRNRI